MADYTRICSGLNDRGTLVKTETLPDIYKSINKDEDHYTSVFYFNDEQYNTFKTKGTIAGITDVWGNKLLFDVDSEKDLELARKDAITIYKRLVRYGFKDENISIFFSGNKGYEVSVQLKARLTPNQTKNICLNIAKGLSTVDSKVYNATRILRMPLTRHQKTGLYKTPLTIDELESLNVEQIKDIAKQPMKYEDIENAWTAANLPKELEDMKNSIPEVKPTRELEALSMDLSTVDWSLKPKFFTPEKYLISLGYFDEGNRSHALMILASTLKNAGFNETHTYHFLKAAAEMQSKRTNVEKFPKEQIYNTIISQVYGPNWLGGTYSTSDDALLQGINKLIPESVKSQNLQDVVSIEEGFSAFSSYAEDIDKNTLKFGIPILDEKLHVQVGRLYGILGSPGSGKTSTAITMINNTSKAGEHSMFFSYDMSQFDVYQKLIQRHTRLNRNDLYNVFKNKDVEQKKKFEGILKDNYKRCTFVFKTGQTIEDIKNTIIEREKRLGVNIRLIIVDYLELVQSRFSDPTQASMECIQGLREVAINLNKAVVVMLQPSKALGSIDEPITSYNSAKGSSSIAQALTAMLTVHRPGYSSRTPENDKFFSIDCVKNRSGALFSCDLSWDGLTGTIRPLERIEAIELKELRDSKRAAQQDDSF